MQTARLTISQEMLYRRRLTPVLYLDNYTKHLQEQEPLLGTSERGPLASSSSLTAAEEGASQEDTKDPNSGKNVSAQNVVKWAIWLLLGAVLVGTVLGTVLVSIPLQRSAHAPGKTLNRLGQFWPVSSQAIACDVPTRIELNGMLN